MKRQYQRIIRSGDVSGIRRSGISQNFSKATQTTCEPIGRFARESCREVRSVENTEYSSLVDGIVPRVYCSVQFSFDFRIKYSRSSSDWRAPPPLPRQIMRCRRERAEKNTDDACLRTSLGTYLVSGPVRGETDGSPLVLAPFRRHRSFLNFP